MMIGILWGDLLLVAEFVEGTEELSMSMWGRRAPVARVCLSYPACISYVLWAVVCVVALTPYALPFCALFSPPRLAWLSFILMYWFLSDALKNLMKCPRADVFTNAATMFRFNTVERSIHACFVGAADCPFSHGLIRILGGAQYVRRPVE